MNGLLAFSVVVVGVGLIWLCGLALAGGKTPKCDGCKSPCPDGFESFENGRWCRGCCRVRGIRPWYWKPRMGRPK